MWRDASGLHEGGKANCRCSRRCREAKRSQGLAAAFILSMLSIQSCAAITRPLDMTWAKQAALAEREPETYLLPIMLFGPNNQKRDLRSFLALAKELNTGIILTGLFKHYLDKENIYHLKRDLGPESPGACFKHENFMAFNESIDRGPIQAWIPTKTVGELRADGWDGKLDALMVAHGRLNLTSMYIGDTMEALGIALSRTAPLLEMDKYVVCGGPQLDLIRRQIKPYRYVAISMVWLGTHLTNDANALRMETDIPPLDRCERHIYQANRLLRPAPWLQALAARYIDKVLKVERYLAVHVRPYPDECLELWRAGNFDDTVAVNASCRAELAMLHLKLGPCVARTLRETGLQHVFILTHPVLQHTVNDMLAKAGVQHVHFLDTHAVTKLAGCEDSSATFLVMVEEVIAYHAAHFIGTSWSSITQSIAYERMSAGLLSNDYFESMECDATTLSSPPPRSPDGTSTTGMAEQG